MYHDVEVSQAERLAGVALASRIVMPRRGSYSRRCPSLISGCRGCVTSAFWRRRNSGWACREWPSGPTRPGDLGHSWVSGARVSSRASGSVWRCCPPVPRYSRSTGETERSRCSATMTNRSTRQPAASPVRRPYREASRTRTVSALTGWCSPALRRFACTRRAPIPVSAVRAALRRSWVKIARAEANPTTAPTPCYILQETTERPPKEGRRRHHLPATTSTQPETQVTLRVDASNPAAKRK